MTRFVYAGWVFALASGLLVPLVPAAEPAPPDADATRRVVAVVVEAAKQNARAAKPVKDDALSDLYVRAAATEAARLPAEQRVPAFLAALGIALDDSTALRGNFVFGPFCRKVEPDADRKARLEVLGKPTMRGRRDWCQHFTVSCALTALSGPSAAEAAGLLKEQLDMRPGGSGFSFGDLAADYAGVALAVRLREGKLTLDAVAKGFTVNDYMPDPERLPEGLTAKQFEKDYGSAGDERFKKETERIRQRIRELPGHRSK